MSKTRGNSDINFEQSFFDFLDGKSKEDFLEKAWKLFDLGNYSEAREYFSYIFNSFDDNEAAFLVGYCYEREENYEEAFNHYKVIEKECPRAGVSLGGFYLNGLYVDKDDTLAFSYFIDALLENVQTPDLYFYLSQCYANALGVEKNDTLAEFYKRLYKKINKATEEELEFKSNLDHIKEEGWKLFDSGKYEDAEKMFLHAVNDFFDNESIFALGYCYEKIENYSEAAKYYELIKDIYPEAKINLGTLYRKGFGVAVDYNKAFKLYTEALEGVADGPALAALYFNLAECYFEGQGIERDEKEAIFYMEEAAKRDLPEAVFKCGYYYERGIGTEIDLSKAIEYYEKAVNLGISNALLSLKRCCKEIGNLTKLKGVLERLSDNNPDACFELADLYEGGYGVTQNFSRAGELYSKALQMYGDMTQNEEVSKKIVICRSKCDELCNQTNSLNTKKRSNRMVRVVSPVTTEKKITKKIYERQKSNCTKEVFKCMSLFERSLVRNRKPLTIQTENYTPSTVYFPPKRMVQISDMLKYGNFKFPKGHSKYNEKLNPSNRYNSKVTSFKKSTLCSDLFDKSISKPFF